MAGESHKPVPSERGLKVNERLTIPENELTWQFTRSGGPGGQHANTSDTRVDVRYDVTTSAVLSDRQRARLIEQFGDCLLYTSPSPRDRTRSRMPSSA